MPLLELLSDQVWIAEAGLSVAGVVLEGGEAEEDAILGGFPGGD